MNVNSTHFEYGASLAGWQRARDVIAGEDAIKAAGTRYLPRLEAQPDAQYLTYRCCASFFNAAVRTADGYVGLIFRRAPFHRLPLAKSNLRQALATFANDADMLGLSLYAYAMNAITEVIPVDYALRVPCGGSGPGVRGMAHAAILARKVALPRPCQILFGSYFVEGFRIQGSGFGSVPHDAGPRRGVEKARANFAAR